jgi:glutamate-1-semialdehyde 2,1-aminomutase
VLIFDEIVTGFRLAYGGAQTRYGVTPDLCTLGKIIGGGFPIAAVAGRKDIMVHFDKSAVGPERWLMMIGTLSGNPVGAVAGLKTMEILRREGAYERLQANGERIIGLFRKHLDAAGIAYRIVGDAQLFDVLFIDRDVRNYRDVIQVDVKKNMRFNAALRENGVFKPMGKVYISLALTEADFEVTENAITKAVAKIAAE